MESEEANHVRSSIDVDKENAEGPQLPMVTSLREEMNKLRPLTANRCIYRVPKPVRVKNPAAYTPKVVSIGPIHYKGEGLDAMEEYKLRYLQLFLDRIHLSLEDFAKFVKDKEAGLRECYEDTIHLTSSEFVKMMMVDSAFVYGMLVGHSYGTGGSCRIFNKTLMVMNVMEDLMLLENQIPLFILQDLFNLENEDGGSECDGGSDGSARQPTSQITEPAGADSFMGLVCKFVNSREDISALSYDINKVSSSTVLHLLDCLRKCHLSPGQLTDRTPSETKMKCCASMPYFPGCPGSHRNPSHRDDSGSLVSKPGSRSTVRRVAKKLEISGYLTLGCLRRHRRPRSQSVDLREEGESSNLDVTVPTITELHQSGVKFAKNTESTHLLDIKFDRQYGTLKIPHLYMGDSTESIFRNLLAFEQCCYEQDLCDSSLPLTGYFRLLDQLISEPSDVDLLVQSGVLGNTLGDSTKAASIINNITQGLIKCDESYFNALRRDLTKYYKKPWHKWKATLRQNYFNNPWAGISVIAAILLLMLTVIQTVYAVI